MRGDERQPTLSSTAAWLKSLTSTVVQNATDSTDRRVFSDCCCERRGLVDKSATRASGGAIATPAHRACARTHSQSPATDGRYGFLSLGAAHRVASADESLLAKACVRSTSSEAASRSALAVLEVCSSGGTGGGTLLRLAPNGRLSVLFFSPPRHCWGFSSWISPDQPLMVRRHRAENQSVFRRRDHAGSHLDASLHPPLGTSSL